MVEKDGDIMDAIIAIGHDGSHDSQAFATGVKGIVTGHGTLNASITGPSWSPDWGEEWATWFAASFETPQAFTLAKHSILSLAEVHNQEAVAFTVGATEVASTGIKEAV
jgi:hypothetical protein